MHENLQEAIRRRSKTPLHPKKLKKWVKPHTKKIKWNKIRRRTTSSCTFTARCKSTKSAPSIKNISFLLLDRVIAWLAILTWWRLPSSTEPQGQCMFKDSESPSAVPSGYIILELITNREGVRFPCGCHYVIWPCHFINDEASKVTITVTLVLFSSAASSTFFC